MEPQVLRQAYEATYRIIFARSMVEILDQDYSASENSDGSIEYRVTAIVVVPVFAHIVQGLLGFVSLCSIALLVISIQRKWSLHSDPATIASVMSLVADNSSLLEDFSNFDRLSVDEIAQRLQDKKFQLEYDERGNT